MQSPRRNAGTLRDGLAVGVWARDAKCQVDRSQGPVLTARRSYVRLLALGSVSLAASPARSCAGRDSLWHCGSALVSYLPFRDFLL